MERKIKIVADSSADILSLEDVPFEAVALKIITADREFTDDKNLDVEEMAEYLHGYRGRSGSACPGVGEWMDSFGDAEEIYCVTITSNLSGCYNSACIAAEEYMSEHPGRKVYVFDSLSAGPEMNLIVNRIRELCLQGLDFDGVVEQTKEYMGRSGLIFILESMQNLANNGRCSHLVAKAAGLLGIRPLGRASDVGTLEMLEKPRGEKASLAAALRVLKELGYKGGKVRIGQTMNESGAQKLRGLILGEFPGADVQIYASGGLCTFYAEKGGLMIGFEK